VISMIVRPYLGAPVSDGQKVFRVGGMALDGVHGSIVCLECGAHLFRRSLRLSTADMRPSHFRSNHEFGRLSATNTHNIGWGPKK